MPGMPPRTDPLASLPLFERLAEPAPASPAGDARSHRSDGAALQASVARELLRLLNRRSVPRANAALSVIDYGLPDWSGLYAANPDDRQRIARSVVRAILAFEPRLREPVAEVEPSPQGQQMLRVRLAGRLVGDNASWPVVFGIAFGPSGAALTLEQGR